MKKVTRRTVSREYFQKMRRILNDELNEEYSTPLYTVTVPGSYLSIFLIENYQSINQEKT